MSFELTILGCNSAIPTNHRKPTAQLLNVAERFFLIDCGEGTQLQLRKYKIRMQSIQHIFISHAIQKPWGRIRISKKECHLQSPM